MRKNKISLEEHVDEIIEKYHIHTPVTSTDIENIIKACGLRLVYSKCIAYPRLDYDKNDNPVIVVDKYDYHIIDDLMYYKVDILHEIGKYLFGNTGYGQFARAILMPRDIYLKVVKDNMDIDKDNRRYFDIVKVAGYFHVQQLEVINRGIDLRIIDIVV